MDEQELIRKHIRDEWKKCALDPSYFIRKYVKILHPTRGTIPFDLYEYQGGVLKEFEKNRFNLILKSRQLGITTLISAYAIWMMLFMGEVNILMISIKQDVSKEIVSKIRFANEKLPSWLRIKTLEDNRLSIKFVNQSQVQAISSAADAGRSKAITLLVLDEAAFIDAAEEIWASAFNTLSTGGRAIVLSTPNGVGNWFHKMWMEAEKRQNDFKTIRLPWNLHPDRDQKWRDEQTKQLGDRLSQQECDCDFLSSGATLIDLRTLHKYEQLYVRPPLFKRRGEMLWIWEEPKPENDYIICCDTARGDGSDYSACHVIDIRSLEQCGEFQGKLSTFEFGDLIYSLASEFNQGLVVVERCGLGDAVLQRLISLEYPNIYYSKTEWRVVGDESQVEKNALKKEEGGMKPGVAVSWSTRPLLIEKLERAVREGDLIIRSTRTISELQTFVWKNGRVEAAEGCNDDLVMSLATGLWVRDTALRLKVPQLFKEKATQKEADPIYTG